MLEKNNDLQLIKAIIKADLSKIELKILLHIMQKPVKTVSTSYLQLSKEIGMAQPNFVRAMKKLVTANVIGKRNNGIFVKSKNSWKSI